MSTWTATTPVRTEQTATSTEVHDALDDEAMLARNLISKGEAAMAATDSVGARTMGLRALEIFERLQDRSGIGDANHLLGRAETMQGQREDAAKRFTAAIAAFESVSDARGRASAVLGLLRTGQPPLEEAKALVERGVRDARSVGDKELEGRLLHSLADKFFAAVQYPEALKTLEESASVLDAAGARDALGTVYNSMGRLYRAHGQVETALDYQLKALAIHDVSGSAFTRLQSLNAVAVTYEALGDLRHARPYYQRALALAEQSSSPRIQDFIRANLADVMRESADDYAGVARTLEGVLARGLDAYPGRRQRNLAAVYVKLGRLDAALAAANKAVEICGARELDCIAAMDQRSAVHEALGDTRSALADVRAALSIIESVRARLVPADFFRQQFNQGQEDTYSRAIALQLRGGQPAEALETAELARSRGFIDLLASKDLAVRPEPPRGGLPLVFRGAELPSQASASPATVADLTATAARLRSTLLVYWVTDDAVFIWVVAPDGRVHTSQVEVSRATLLDLVRSTATFAATGGKDVRPAAGVAARRDARNIPPRTASASAWRELYTLLIKPVRHSLPRTPGALLTVVPHGPLGALAFAALQDERGRYLLEDYTLHYAPAGAVLQFTSTKRRADSRSGSILMVADPVPPVLSTFERPLPRLPGARAETRAIAGMIRRTRVTMLEGHRANEVAVRGAASGKAILHFATHAIVRDDDPFVVVSRGWPGAGRRGRWPVDRAGDSTGSTSTPTSWC